MDSVSAAIAQPQGGPSAEDTRVRCTGVRALADQGRRRLCTPTLASCSQTPTRSRDWR